MNPDRSMWALESHGATAGHCAVHIGCERSWEELAERLRQNDPNAGGGAAKEEKKPPYSDAKCTQNSISWEYVFYVVIREMW